MIGALTGTAGTTAWNADPWSAVAAGATPGETQAAIADSGDEGIVTSLGGGAAVESPTYSAAGLLNAFVQAGTPLADPAGTWPDGSAADSGLAGAVQSDDGAVLGAEDASGDAGASSAGNYQSVWGSLLKADPGLSGTVAADAFDQAIVGTLSVLA